MNRGAAASSQASGRDWFGAVLDPMWDIPRRRLFLKYAFWFYQMRGTITGLLVALQLAFDECADQAIVAGIGVAHCGRVG